MTWELHIQTDTKEHVIDLETDDEAEAAEALDAAKTRMGGSARAVTIAGRVAVVQKSILSVSLKKSSERA